MSFPDSDDPLTFEVWLYQDGRVLINVLVFPASAASQSSLQMGLEDIFRSKFLSVPHSSLPWAAGQAFAVTFVPWFMPRGNTGAVVAAQSNVDFSFAFEEVASHSGYLQVYSFEVGKNEARHQVRFSQHNFRLFWDLSFSEGRTGMEEFTPGRAPLGSHASARRPAVG
ncbi:unnamed protein product [Polarella glacialis]|uniref:Uncharacterized protein n=1 Tax=Polarella glacialis TaxID=89957 RepID=A0A813HZM9_POLGL|nr:unnamed protein product [Polarella glacialis]